MTQLVNLLIGTLVISAICVYVLILRRLKRKHEQSGVSENKIEKWKSRRGRATFNRSEGLNPKCSFYVGYLGTLAKGSTPPEECLTCPDGALCTIVPKKPIPPKKPKRNTKGQAKRKNSSKRKKTTTSQTKRGRTKKKPRGKTPPS